jgi:hypothetical protein
MDVMHLKEAYAQVVEMVNIFYRELEEIVNQDVTPNTAVDVNALIDKVIMQAGLFVGRLYVVQKEFNERVIDVCSSEESKEN